MELRQMEVAVAVAEAGGFTAAARRLNVVQSAVSSTVRSLERELGTRLFERTTVAASELVRNDLGVCVMPESIAARFPDLSVRRFDRHAPSWKVMVVRPRGEASPAVAALLRHIG
ncbi:LysR family transcriptional regulator [Actinomadura viridis]|uniref:LysR family transcriptional regulator n=1 Tax=Actinomadura viridis TaxID=58110 RepID=UPI0036A31F91